MERLQYNCSLGMKKNVYEIWLARRKRDMKKIESVYSVSWPLHWFWFIEGEREREREREGRKYRVSTHHKKKDEEEKLFNFNLIWMNWNQI